MIILISFSSPSIRLSLVFSNFARRSLFRSSSNCKRELLSIDHIAGRKQMDSELKLVKLGYSSSMVGTTLLRWIIKNNFPEGFKILCHNCNSAIAVYGKCPHKK